MSYRKDPKDLHAVPTRPLLPLTNHVPLCEIPIFNPADLPSTNLYDYTRDPRDILANERQR